MGTRKEKREAELLQRANDEYARQLADIENRISALPASTLPSRYNEASLSDGITAFQVASGLIEPDQNDRLSVGNQNLLWNSAVENLRRSQERWPDDTVFGADGQAYQPGALAGTFVPAKPLIKTSDDIIRRQAENESYQRISGRMWTSYQLAHPYDDPRDVEEALRGLMQQTGASAADLESIYEDPVDRAAAFETLANAVDQVAGEREVRELRSQADTYDDRTDMLGGGAGGHSPYSTGHQPKSHNSHEPGSLSALLQRMRDQD
ncbi:hypothetical protein [Ensifer sp. Root278]|uniref:hypothetical protein n=1 Tax=Ensifer sp. Root278 TaxID=1736509 RepID=UPI0007106324|nr:hypothetical protein [Ensifer sp. Root278]KRD71812.1 hypothetical protein ASE60_24755 [Ensifer sp. Root278]